MRSLFERFFDFKSEEERAEFFELIHTNVSMQTLMLYIGTIAHFYFDKKVMVTDVYRSDLKSLHYHGRAIDARVYHPDRGDVLEDTLTEREWAYIEQVLEPYLQYGEDTHEFMVTHGEGFHRHCHIQVKHKREKLEL